MPARFPGQQQHLRRNAGQAAQQAVQSRRPGQAAEGLVNEALANDVAQHPGPQEQYRPGRQDQQQEQDQEEREQQEQDEDIQIVDPTQEVRNW